MELTKEEERFFEKIKEQDVQKISINISKETLEKIDFLAKAFHLSRTLVLESILRVGIKNYLETVENANKKLKIQFPEKKERLNIMLNKIKEFKTKWPN